MELKSCPECGVPEIMTSEHQWLNNGDIVQSRAQTSRILFNETENLDPLFRGMAQIIGSEIEHMIITTSRRAFRVYLRAFVPKETREKIQNNELDYEPIDAAFRDLAGMNGSGRYDFVGMRYEQDEQDYCTVNITKPYSIPMNVSAHVGAIECLSGVDQGYKYEEVSTDVYNITAFPSPHPVGLKERLWFDPYHHRDGDLELERCGTCGGPKALSTYQWHPDQGIVVDKATRRRIAIQGNAQLDPVFHELEAELGDTVPRVVVEAQRRFTRSGFYTMDDIIDEEDFRTQLALRGMGNLKQLEMKRKGMNMRVENVALPLIVIGHAQGLFEMGFDVDTTVDWELSEEGDLQVEVKPMTYE
jgi:hypothetical protein